ncbi:RING-H2 finger protein ATL2-like [Canna indica]|uniref:RING-H2 finger protein ATL2-like n=1 Tax=Canna indica TaxID=4628 RepID=A0AAQ3K2N5_9LILI|nr:RING-H2 finger protein ATL2-like [Canna indica]
MDPRALTLSLEKPTKFPSHEVQPKAERVTMSAQQSSSFSNTGEEMSLAFAFGICVLVFVAICIICSRRQARIATAAAIARHDLLRTIAGGGLGKAEIASLPAFAYRNPVESGGGSCSRASDASVQCVVCLSAMAEGEMVRMLPRCRHVFHVDCVDMWLFSHSTCPLCRADAKAERRPPPSVAAPEVSPPV